MEQRHHSSSVDLVHILSLSTLQSTSLAVCFSGPARMPTRSTSQGKFLLKIFLRLSINFHHSPVSKATIQLELSTRATRRSREASLCIQYDGCCSGRTLEANKQLFELRWTEAAASSLRTNSKVSRAWRLIPSRTWCSSLTAGKLNSWKSQERIGKRFNQ